MIIDTHAAGDYPTAESANAGTKKYEIDKIMRSFKGCGNGIFWQEKVENSQ